MRTTTEISAELKGLYERANLAFVPPNVTSALALMVEFCESAASELAAGQAVTPAVVPGDLALTVPMVARPALAFVAGGDTSPSEV
jgi:hypothetical protein